MEFVIRNRRALQPRTKRIVVAIGVSVVAAAVTVSALASSPTLWAKPTQIGTLSLPKNASGTGSRNFSNLKELQRTAGFTLYVPAASSAGCTLSKLAFVARVGEAQIGYGCFQLSETHGSGLASPLVGPGGASDVTVNGNPAYYINGVWDQNGGWLVGQHQQVLLVQGNTFIRVINTSSLSEQQLIDVAGGLQGAG